MGPAARSHYLVLGALLMLLLGGRCRAEGTTGNGTGTTATWKGFSVACTSEELQGQDGLASCHGIRLVRRIVQGLLEEVGKRRSLEIADGVSLVQRDEEEEDGTKRAGRVLKGFGEMRWIVRFLEGRELRIGLPSLLPGNWVAAVEGSLPATDEGNLWICAISLLNVIERVSAERVVPRENGNYVTRIFLSVSKGGAA